MLQFARSHFFAICFIHRILFPNRSFLLRFQQYCHRCSDMAYMLFKYIRRRVRENKERREALVITDDSHLVPEANPGSRQEHERGPHSSNGHVTNHMNSSDFNSHLTKEEHQRLKQEQKELAMRRWKLIIGLILPNFLASIDVTIVAPATNEISTHFSKFSHFMLHGMSMYSQLIVARSNERKFQLARRRLHSHVYYIRAHVGPAGRCLRSSFRTPLPDVLGPRWQRTLRSFSGLDHVAVWTSTSGVGGCWSDEPHKDRSQ